MKSFLYIFFILYTLDKNSNFKYKIRNSQYSKSNKNNKNSKKNMITFFMNHFYFINHLYSLCITSFFYKHSNFKNEIRNSRCLKSNKKSKNRKSKNDYIFLNISATILYKKKFHFLTKNRFLINLFLVHLMHIKNRLTYNR